MSATVFEDSLRPCARIDHSAREVFHLFTSSFLQPDTGEIGKIERARRETPFAARNNEMAHGFGCV